MQKVKRKMIVMTLEAEFFFEKLFSQDALWGIIQE